MEETDVVTVDAPPEARKIPIRWQQRAEVLRWYMVIFGAIVAAPIVVIVLLRMRSRGS